MKKAPILFIAASLLLSACSGGGEKATVQRTFDPNVLPEEYGLVRNGIDVELYRPDIDRCLSQFYEGFA
nr:hypothetical protein [Bacilli bacterium]